MNSFSNKFRKHNLENASSGVFDVIIIGGGITGAGIALDASSRGLKVCLVEKNDFASGTSSKSTKLIHGGLRYLQSLQFGLVRETAKERQILLNNIPHLITPQDIVIPVYRSNKFSMATLAIGLNLYELLGSVKRSERNKRLSKNEISSLIPGLKETDLKGGFIYNEYRTDDARLVIETLKEACTREAVAFNYFQCMEISKTDNMFSVECSDLLDSKKYMLRSRAVINAGGPWVDDIRKINNNASSPKLILSKGIHIVFEKSKMPLEIAVYFENYDGRLIFCIPLANDVYVGTTDTFYQGSKDEVEIEIEDISYLIKAINSCFPYAKLKTENIKSSWAGLRPLIFQKGKTPGEISRKDEIFIADNGLISIAGGKLTGFRKMAEKVVDLIYKRNYIKKPFAKSGTESLVYQSSMYSSDFVKETHAKYPDVDYSTLLNLFNKYGKNIERILNFYRDGNTIMDSEIKYTIDDEMIASPADFIFRRTTEFYYRNQGLIELWKQCERIMESEGMLYPEIADEELKKVKQRRPF